jgi:hypothetical protein
MTLLFIDSDSFSALLLSFDAEITPDNPLLTLGDFPPLMKHAISTVTME